MTTEQNVNSNWINTTMDNVSVSWDAETKSAKISHRYQIDEDGNPVETLDVAETQRACEAALDGIGVHVLLSINANADAGEPQSDGWAEAVMYPKVDETWVPTHKITFTPQGGEPVVEYVMLLEEGHDGAAFDRDEWRSEANASWCVADGEWYCEGQASPGGQNGSVEIEALEVPDEADPSDAQSQACDCAACALASPAKHEEAHSKARMLEDPEGFATTCASLEINAHVFDEEMTGVEDDWMTERGWEETADEWASVENDGHRIKLRAAHTDLDEDEFEALLDLSQDRFKKHFCAILAKHYAWVLS